jgi:hypothetical protein
MPTFIPDSGSGSCQERDAPAAGEEWAAEPLHQIPKTTDPQKYGIRVSDYLTLSSWR